jgi:hypothetical protein
VATTSTAVNNLKERIEDRMLTDGKTGEEVQVWSNEVEGLLAEADNCTRQLTKELKILELAAQETAMMQEQQRIFYKCISKDAKASYYEVQWYPQRLDHILRTILSAN